MNEFPLASRFEPAPRVLSRKVDNEIVLFDLDNESYFGLNPVGARLWQLLADGQDVGAAMDKLLAEYDVERPQLLNDISGMLTDLLQRGLLREVG